MRLLFFYTCFHNPTDTQEDLIPWDYPEDSLADLTIEGRAILLDRSVSVGSRVGKLDQISDYDRLHSTKFCFFKTLLD